jgi:flagellar biosynthesis protein FlhG
MKSDVEKKKKSNVVSLHRRRKGSVTHLWGITSGKGGAGKSFVTSSLALTLCKLGYSVVLVDFDSAGPNLHTMLGLNPSVKNLRSFFEEDRPLFELVESTNIPHLSLIQGFGEAWGPTEISAEQTQKLIQSVQELTCDFILFDLGAGATVNHLEVLKHCQEKFLVTSPEPTCIEKTYRFLESYICYSLKQDATYDSYRDLSHKLREFRHEHRKEYFHFKKYLQSHEGFNIDYFEKISENPVRLIVNGTRSHLDQELGFSMKSVCQKYYDISIDFAGSIDFDNSVWQSIRKREPTLVNQPFTPLSGQFLSICKHVVPQQSTRVAV